MKKIIEMIKKLFGKSNNVKKTTPKTVNHTSVSGGGVYDSNGKPVTSGSR